MSCVLLGRGVLNCVTVRQARRVLLGLIESSSVAVRLGESWQARSVALSYTRVWQCKLRYGKAGEVGYVVVVRVAVR